MALEKHRDIGIDLFNGTLTPHERDAFEIACIYILEEHDPRHALAVSLYYGFTGHKPATYKVIGQQIGRHSFNNPSSSGKPISVDRARQIVLNSLHILRKPCNQRKLLHTIEQCSLYWGGL